MWKSRLCYIVLCAVWSISSLLIVSSECNDHKSCVECTSSTSSLSYHCQWNTDADRTLDIGWCSKRFPSNSNGINTYYFDDTCPVHYVPSSTFVSNWMTELYPVIKELTLLDLSLPGTHDTLTFDLSTTVSEGGMDDALLFAELMHNYSSIVPDGIEDFIRRQAQTHDLTITEQLDAGIRFLDFRMMMEYSDPGLPWYSLHMVQSVALALDYYGDIRAWLDTHPGEILVIFVSKHGSGCKVGQDQYPNVTVAQKLYMWENMLDTFEGLVVDFSLTALNETTISTMLERNHRVVFYMADYEEMTGSSQYALDQCADVDNGSKNPGVFKLEEAIPWQQDMYTNATDRKSEDKKGQKFYKVSLATGGSMTQIVSAAILDFVPSSSAHDLATITQTCADDFNIPLMTWCPNTLLDIAQLEAFYTQIAMNQVMENTAWSLPNGMVLNGLDRDGTIRTGTQVLWGGVRNVADEEHWKTSFGYVDTFIAVNWRLACGDGGHGAGDGSQGRRGGVERAGRAVETREGKCKQLWARIAARRELHPYSRWDDAALGRSATWPV